MEKRTLQNLKDSKKIKVFNWDVHHINDFSIPSAETQWFYDINEPEGPIIGMSNLNHTDQPYMYMIQNGDLAECFDFSNLGQTVYRPK